MLLAIKEINAAGGVNGRKIAAVFEDDGHSPTKALAAVKKLVEQDKVFAVMSVGGSNATVGAVDYMKEKGVPYYVSIASAPQVTWPYARNLFRGGTTETARYGELYAEFLATHYKAKRIAIMSGREEYPRNEGDATVDKLKNWFQMAPVARVEFNIGDKDFTPQLVEVQKANPRGDRVLRQSRGGRDRDAPGEGARPEAAVLRRQQHGRSGADHRREGNAEGVTGFSLIPYLPGSKAPDMVKWEAAWKKEYPERARRPAEQLRPARVWRHVRARRGDEARRPRPHHRQPHPARSKACTTTASGRSRRRARSRPSITSAISRSCR